MTVSRLTAYTPSDLEQLHRLLSQLTPDGCCREEQLQRVLADANAYLYVVRDEQQIIGCATLCRLHTIEQTLGAIEAVVVSSEYRGRHLGRQLMERIIADARELGIEHLHLTSNPQRVAANLLYRSLGFQQKQTNCYTMPL